MEYQSQFTVRGPLRCTGPGSLDVAQDVATGDRLAVRWIPLEASGQAVLSALRDLPATELIPKVRHSGTTEDHAYFAIDFPEGKLLPKLLRERLSVERACRLTASLAETLAALHAVGLHHGELCAESILITEDGRPLLWDAPLVVADRISDRRNTERFSRKLPQVVAFLPPEVARGMPTSASTDIYALGALLCRMTGDPAPSAMSTLAVLHQVANGDWSPRCPTDAPVMLRELVLRMCCPDPHRRVRARAVADGMAMAGAQTSSGLNFLGGLVRGRDLTRTQRIQPGVWRE